MREYRLKRSGVRVIVHREEVWAELAKGTIDLFVAGNTPVKSAIAPSRQVRL